MKRTSLQETATESIKNLGNHVTEMGDKVSDFVAGNTEVAREHLADAYNGVRKSFAAGVNSSRLVVHEHPLESVFVALGVGLVIGALSAVCFGRRRHR